VVARRGNDHAGELSSQGKKFVETARELGCDEDEGAFKERLGKLLSAPVPPKDTEAVAPKGKNKLSKKSR
jgi:hypothetical protein